MLMAGTRIGRIVLLASALGTLPSLALAASYGLSVKISPSAKHEGAYELAATVSDLATGKVVSAPRLLFVRGEEATTSTVVPESRHEVTVTANVDAGQSSASYTLVVKDAGTVISQQAGEVKLK